MDPARFFAASRVLIVAGKGGVGKSTMSAALARTAAQAGISTLLLRLTPGGPVGRLFGQQEGTGTEQLLHPGGGPHGDAEVRGRVVTADEALADYLVDHGLGRITRRLASTGAVDVVITAAPGIRDLLVLGRVKALETTRAAELIILDAPAAGHAVSFLQSPTGLRAAVGAGPIATQADDVLEMLADPERCRVMLVTLAEETPVNEIVDTAFALEDEIGIALGPIIVNGLVDLPTGLDHEALAQFDEFAKRQNPKLSKAYSTSLRDAASFRLRWAERQYQQVERLSTLLPLAQIAAPQLFTAAQGPNELQILSDALTGGISQLSEEDT
ncbi:MAG: ArsA-related P-loop ATPase [Acidimicrobiales bacterium]